MKIVSLKSLIALSSALFLLSISGCAGSKPDAGGDSGTGGGDAVAAQEDQGDLTSKVKDAAEDATEVEKRCSRSRPSSASPKTSRRNSLASWPPAHPQHLPRCGGCFAFAREPRSLKWENGT